MKKKILLAVSFLLCLVVCFVNGCKKDNTIGTSASFAEEFVSVYLLQSKGWDIINNTTPYNPDKSAKWEQGSQGVDKLGVPYGFPAYSGSSAGEYIRAWFLDRSGMYAISSWLITPVLSVRNGDKISFYTRADTGTYADRLQVRINKSSSKEVGTTATSEGSFTTTIIDVNEKQAENGYPTTWTRYEYTFTGIGKRMDTRIAFRYYVPNTFKAKSIAIDQFTFQRN